MNKFWTYFLNSIFFLIVILLAVSVSTIAITKKVNEYRAQNMEDIKGSVVKDIVPVLALSKGLVTSIEVKNGDVVKKGQVLLKIDNPLLRTKVSSLKTFDNNASAQTEAKVAEEELKNLTLVSPVDGIVGSIDVNEGGVIEELTKAMEIYSSNNVRLLVPLTVEEYQKIQQQQNIRAYSARLNQSFAIQIEKLKPEAEEDKKLDEKKLGLYFTFANKRDAASLIHNEDLDLKFTRDDTKVTKPIDYFINFWNGLLSQNN